MVNYGCVIINIFKVMGGIMIHLYFVQLRDIKYAIKIKE